ncbi:hypothetical protein QFC19_001655 [Naganishia cerealis]|uniref:Uncharacterized protein n=1 Tax=Naganishia cerealis TaxID=610337 RepID=A0ACC2WI59_9TREE|nr:hypothetical protein QFC19_001655 [Naganishia cerealis]
MPALSRTVISREVAEQVSRSSIKLLWNLAYNVKSNTFPPDPSSNPSYLTNDPESGIGPSVAAGFTSAGGFGSDGIGSTNGTGSGSAGSNVWESRLGLRIDVLAALAKLYLILGILLTAYTAFRAFRDPNASPGGPAAQAQAAMMNNGVLPRFYLPIIGDLAERSASTGGSEMNELLLAKLGRGDRPTVSQAYGWE